MVAGQVAQGAGVANNVAGTVNTVTMIMDLNGVNMALVRSVTNIARHWGDNN